MQRRDFLKLMGVGAGAVSVGAVAKLGQANAASPARAPIANPHVQQTEDWQSMNTHHQEGVEIFLAGIGSDPNFWRPPMEPEMDGNVKVFNLVCQEVDWDTGAGMTFPAMTYNGMAPGPTIRVTEGDTVRFVVTNEMTQPHNVHFHGLRVPNNVDGVPFVTQPSINPGETVAYEFTVRNYGTHMYHSHFNSAEQNTRGMLGALIVDPLDASREPQVAADYVWILNDSALGYTFNGKGFPYTQPIVAQLGDRIRVRYMNEGLMIHPMHLHGIPQLVIAQDGFMLPTPYWCDTLNIAPGQRFDVLIDCDEPGAWAYHCHILSHAEGRDGMFGMVSVLVVQE